MLVTCSLLLEPTLYLYACNLKCFHFNVGIVGKVIRSECNSASNNVSGFIQIARIKQVLDNVFVRSILCGQLYYGFGDAGMIIVSSTYTINRDVGVDLIGWLNEF